MTILNQSCACHLCELPKLYMSAGMNAPFHAHAWFMLHAHCMHVCSIWFTGMYAPRWCSISLVCYALHWRPRRDPGNPCSVQSTLLLSQHDPAWLWGPIVVPQKYWSPINLLLLQGPPSSLQQYKSSPYLPACHLYWLHFSLLLDWAQLINIPLEFTSCFCSCF